MSQQLTLHNGLLDGQAVQVLLDTGSETSIARTSLQVNLTKHSKEMVIATACDIISYPSAMADLRMSGGWEGKINAALFPDVSVDVVLTWNDLGPAIESLITAGACRIKAAVAKG